MSSTPRQRAPLWSGSQEHSSLRCRYGSTLLLPPPIIVLPQPLCKNQRERRGESEIQIQSSYINSNYGHFRAGRCRLLCRLGTSTQTKSDAPHYTGLRLGLRFKNQDPRSLFLASLPRTSLVGIYPHHGGLFPPNMETKRCGLR